MLKIINHKYDSHGGFVSIPLLSVQLFPYDFEMMIFLKESSIAFSGLSSERALLSSSMLSAD